MHQHGLTGVQLLTAYRHLSHPWTADYCHKPLVLLVFSASFNSHKQCRDGKWKSFCDFWNVCFCSCVKRDIMENVCLFIWCTSDLSSLWRVCKYVCAFVGGWKVGLRIWEMFRSAIKMFSCRDRKKNLGSRRNTVAGRWEWSELWTSERSDGVGRRSEQTLHSFPQPFKQPRATMATPLCVFPNYPNPLHILSHTHKFAQKKKTHTHTSWAWQSPSPLHAYQHREPSSSHTHSFPVISQIKAYAERLVLTAGTRSFLTSLMARWSLILARLCVSSTVIRTWRSSLRCSQLGFPRFISSWNAQIIYKTHENKRFGLNAPHRLSPLPLKGNRTSLFFLGLARLLDRTQTNALARLKVV